MTALRYRLCMNEIIIDFCCFFFLSSTDLLLDLSLKNTMIKRLYRLNAF